MNIPFSPVRIYNIFLDEIQELPSIEFTSCIIGPVLPLVDREFKEENTYTDNTHYYLNFIFNSNEFPVNYNFYISPQSKRPYVKPRYELYTYYKGVKIPLRPNDDYVANESNNRFELQNISSGNFNLFLGDISLKKINCYSDNNNLYVEFISSSSLTSYGVILEKGLTLKTSSLELTIVDIIPPNKIKCQILTQNVTCDNVNDFDTYETYGLFSVNVNNNQFTISNITLNGVYRVFKSFKDNDGKPIVLKIDNTIKVKTNFAGDVIDDLDNLLFVGCNILLKNMTQRKAFYVIPLISQDEQSYFDAFDKITQLTFENEIPYEITVLTMNDTILNGLIDFIIQQNDPLYSNPIRCFIAPDLPLYDYDWKVGNMDMGSGYSYLVTENTGLQTIGVSTVTITDVVKIEYTGTDPSYNPSYSYVVFTDNSKSFIIVLDRNDVNVNNANNIVTFPLSKIKYVIGKQLTYDNLKTITLTDDANIQTSYSGNSIAYSITPQSLEDVKNYWINYANNERVNIVNPWLIMYDKERLPGFYLSCARIGQSVGEPIISKPTSAEPINLRDIVERPDYSIEVFGPLLFDALINGGIDVCLIYDGIFQSWHQRTSYKGTKIDAKYQNTIKALDYFNWRQKKIALRYTRKYALSSQIINRLRTELELNLNILKSNTSFGPVLGPSSKIMRIIVVRDPSDIPPDIPVSLEAGVIIVNKVELLRPWLVTIIYNMITSH
jgi:hypothetical protein